MSYVRNQGSICSVEDCEDLCKCKRLCQTHYDRLRRRGTTDPYVFVSPTRRVCSECKIDKPIDAYYTSGKLKSGLTRYTSACKECRHLSQRKYMLPSKYGITEDQYNAMLDGQNGVCAICKSHNKFDKPWALAVDHDHETNEVRGLLCQACNRTLGLMGESISSLRAAADYLEARS